MTDQPPAEPTDRTPAQWLRWFLDNDALSDMAFRRLGKPSEHIWISMGLSSYDLGDTRNELARVVARAEAEERHQSGIERLQAVADLCETMRGEWAGLVYDGGVHTDFMDAIIPALDAVKAEEKPNGEL
jgi:hypothetical protein